MCIGEIARLLEKTSVGGEVIMPKKRVSRAVFGQVRDF